MKVIILGAGLAGISTAFFLQNKEEINEIILLEKEENIGGLCRSIHCGDYVYDIGPHILFSKDKEMLQLMLDALGDNRNDLKRFNQIIYKNRYIQYPFENDLSKLPYEDLDYCIKQFQSNPYENYDANNMLQFFLKTFGEGITNTYLRPYNEKIWKYDPCFMDMQMVERIPKPTKEDIIKSASGQTVDGYVHQLYFSFPASGGIESVIKGFVDSLTDKCKIKTSKEITNISRVEDSFIVCGIGFQEKCDLLVSTIPIQELTKVYTTVTSNVKKAVNALKYNSIIVAFVKTRKDLCGNNFAFMIPEKNIIFHRISKMDFLGDNYKSSGATYMVEITYRENDQIDTMPNEKLEYKIIEGLKQIKFIENNNDAKIINISKHKYAYVIYDLLHSYNMKIIREFYSNEGIYLNGRFGNFEYWNMDKVLRESKRLVEEFSK